MSNAGDITTALVDVTEGRASAETLVPVLYPELHDLALRYLGREASGHTLSATALVHEAYLRLVDQTRVTWKNHAHFMAVAATVMRRILVDHARRKARHKRRGALDRISLDDALTLAADQPTTGLLALDEGLARLAERDPEKAKVVELRFFGGLNYEEIGEALGISPRTARRAWQYAKAWLYREIAETSE
jgi:RNA polymerase sigma factor (TIGR02999 family)